MKFQELSGSYMQKGDSQLYILTRLPADEDLTELNYNNLTLTAKTIFIILNNNVLSTESVPKVEVFNKIAAASNGHFVVVNDQSLSSVYRNDYGDVNVHTI
uniref:Recep_L_domain domain-containing protein n=1 Tax=Caenorhabditis tropicalis TaxID=1561998 RepID=A0A1I7TLK4_9PELO